MIAASRRSFLVATILIVVLSATVHARIVRYQTAIRSLANGSATFRTVDAIPARDEANPARVFTGGFYSDQFQIGTTVPGVTSKNREDGILAALTNDPERETWETDWLLTVDCEGGDAVIDDIAMGPDGLLVVVGTFENLAQFEREGQNPVVLNGNGLTSFIALADIARGTWVRAQVAPEMVVRSVAVDGEGTIFVTGPGSLARSYSASLQELWNIEEPPGTLYPHDIAVGIGEDQPFVYVQGVLGTQGNNDLDVFVVQLNKASGETRWNTRISSLGGSERPGGLAVDSRGNLRSAVSSDGLGLTVAETPVKDNPTQAARHAHLLFLEPEEGKLINDRLLGNSNEPQGVMEPHNLDIDYAGNTYVAVSFSGSFRFRQKDHAGVEDSAVIVTDARAVPMRFIDSEGNARSEGLDVAAAGRNLQFLVGEVQGTTVEFFGTSRVEPAQVNKAFLAILEPPADQQRYLITVETTEELEALTSVIDEFEGESYRVIDEPSPNNPQRRIHLVATHLTTEQFALLPQNIPVDRIQIDRELTRNGSVGGADWAMQYLNGPDGDFDSPDDNYYYSDTDCEIVLYLIDTGVNPATVDGWGWSSIVGPVDEQGDPPVGGGGAAYTTPDLNHGTEMLSMIASVSRGTPITVVNYNIYPDPLVPTTVSDLISAINQANLHKGLNHPDKQAVFCIASSTTDPGITYPTLVSAIETSVDTYNATVLVSAGNEENDASNFTPSFLGAEIEGVICVGAINSKVAKVAHTRTGPEMWAPGDTVGTISADGSTSNMSGTSASTALAAGAALIYRSANPFLMAAATEEAMKNSGADGFQGMPASPDGEPMVYVPNPTVPGSADLLNHMSYEDWADWYSYLTPLDADGVDDLNGNDIDSDGDGWTDKEEYFFLGSDPSPGTPGQPPFDTGSGNGYRNSILGCYRVHEQSTLVFDFPLACYLIDQQKLSDLQNDGAVNSLLLRDGSELVIERTNDPEAGIWETWPNMDQLESDHAAVPSGLGPDTAIMRFAVDLPEDAVDFYLYRVRITPPSP